MRILRWNLVLGEYLIRRCRFFPRVVQALRARF
jgi:hypothetical protein